ncbi:PadR family transcriptional regulator [Pullulanibacillus pueri]|uniref:PadR family transcriptional regulator n=1 Tax=Pullulanibacillus pueri TaxID=1437324 RepID=A0A8J3ENA5_9BACL|nr:PadR family transcriptional regulator [Pullulanibacillus pueri]GGH86023.1 hypothetical protein GCM10007096_32760 [Pullulanibacillus pueri]
MSLKYGILGFLSEWPGASGYDLKKEFDTFMNPFWHTHLSQIYPELNHLEEEGYVHSEIIEQTAKPDKKIYTITEKGKTFLRNWLSSSPESPKIKEAFLMRTFFLDNVTANEAIFQLQLYKKRREDRLKAMKKTLKERLTQIKNENAALTPRILMIVSVYKKGLDEEKRFIRWCEDTIKLVQHYKDLWKKEENQEEILISHDSLEDAPKWFQEIIDEIED